MNEEQCVARGVILLDEKLPGWREAIDWDILDVWSIDKCIIAQLRFEGFGGVFKSLGLYSYTEGGQYGFDVLETTTFPALDDAWRAWAKENINQ